jgi:hypothetical protein
MLLILLLCFAFRGEFFEFRRIAKFKFYWLIDGVLVSFCSCGGTTNSSGERVKCLTPGPKFDASLFRLGLEDAPVWPFVRKPHASSGACRMGPCQHKTIEKKHMNG